MSWMDEAHDTWCCWLSGIRRCINPVRETWACAWALHHMRHLDAELHASLLYAYRQARALRRRGTRGRR